MFIVIVILTIGQTFSENLYFQKRYENMTETGLTKADGDTLMSWLYFNEDGKWKPMISSNKQWKNVMAGYK